MAPQTATDFAAFVLRAANGLAFLAHGLLKVNVFTIAGTVGYFESLGLPGFLAYLTIGGELAGGAALILGVGTRAAAVALVPLLLGAVWVHGGNGWLFSSEGGGWEFPVFWAAALVATAFLGRGAFALRVPVLDRTLGRFA